MIKVYAATEDGQGYVQSLGEYEEIGDIRIYSAALGPHVLITFFDDWTEEDEEKKEKESETIFPPIMIDPSINNNPTQEITPERAGVLIRGKDVSAW